jgi:hypothetical protein
VPGGKFLLLHKAKSLTPGTAHRLSTGCDRKAGKIPMKDLSFSPESDEHEVIHTSFVPVDTTYSVKLSLTH